MNGGSSQAYNLGNGNGFSVQEVIDTAEAVTGRKIVVVNAPRREGDPARLVATLQMKNFDASQLSHFTGTERYYWISRRHLLTPTEPDKHSEFEPQQLSLL
jgi:UDP-glucose 4-epimerase